jgi:hypothetical protein
VVVVGMIAAVISRSLSRFVATNNSTAVQNVGGIEPFFLSEKVVHWKRQVSYTPFLSIKPSDTFLFSSFLLVDDSFQESELEA